MKKLIRPAFVPDITEQTTDRMDVAEQVTAPIRLFTPSRSHPTTPIPPAVIDIQPFFRGVMPLPPSINDAYKVVKITARDGREVHRIGPTGELDRFKQDAALLLPASSRSYVDWSVLNALRATRVKTPLGVKLEAYFLSEWKRDLDGIIKHSIDACFEFLRLNDNLVTKLEAEKLVDAEDPRIEIEVRTLVRQ